MPFEGGSVVVDPADPAAIRIEGQVLDGTGEPVTDALIEAWSGKQFARCRTDSEGAYHVVLRRPGPSVGSAPHLELTIFARGLLRDLATRIYFADESTANAEDPVLRQVETSRRGTLIAKLQGPSFHFDIRLQGHAETVFFEL